MKKSTKRSTARLCAALLAAAFAAAPVAAGTVDVGWRERAEIRIAAGETATQTDRVSVDGTGRLYKTGAGTLVLPAASVVQPAPPEIGVLGGNLTLQAGGAAPAIARPSVIDEKAALWLDAASANLLATNGTPYRQEVHPDATQLVAEWLDARATSASDSRYLRATPIWWTDSSASVHLGGEGIPPAVVSAYGKTGVWFGGADAESGRASGQSLLLKSAAQATDSVADGAKWTLDYTTLQNVFHVFLVQAVSNHWGHILGNYLGSATPVRDFYSSYSLSAAILQYGGTSYAGAMDTGRMFFDGASVDPWTDSMENHTGLHLMEFELTDRPAQFSAFFRDSSQSATAGLLRNGGDYLFEAVVFTNKVTDAERMQVRAYLMDKWGVPACAAAPTVRLEGGTATFAPESGSPVTVGGAGAAAFDADASAVLPLAPEVVAVPESGAAYAVESGLCGDAISAAPGATGVIAKSGRGRLSVATLPESAVSVAGGVLRLAPAAAPSAVDSIVAEPADSSFESYTNNATLMNLRNPRVNTRVTITAGASTQNSGFKREDLTGYYNQSMAIYNFDTCNTYFSSWPAPDGVAVMMLKGEGVQATATVTPPADGVYEFSFYASGRQNYLNKGNRNHFEFFIGEDESSMVKFGDLVKSDSPYYRVYYRTPRLVGGTPYLLRLRSKVIDSANVDGTVDFDDLRLRLVPDSELDTAAIPVPNGDFEETVELLSPTLNAANTAEGWEFAVETAFGTGATPNVALVEQGISAYNRDYNTYSGSKTSPYTRAFYSYYDCFGENVFGFAQLGLFGDGAVARTTSQFVPPSGTYRLRLDASRRSTVSVNGQNISSAPTIEAKVSVGGGAAASVGSLTVLSHALAPVEFPDSFTVDGTQAVVIELRQTRASGGALVDNLALVPVADPEELLSNGSFEECTSRTQAGYYNANDWSYDNHADSSVSGYSSSAVWERFDRDAKNYDVNIVDGVMRAKIRGQSEISQSGLALAAGFHRLRFWAESRHAQGAAPNSYGRNPIRAYLTSGTATNDIGWTYVDSTNFVEHAFLFRVQQAGTYTLHLQGMSAPDSDWWDGAGTANDRLSHIDAVSLKAVDAADVPETPGLSSETTIAVASGARLELEFAGTQRLGSLRLGGRGTYGIVSAATHPEYLSGPGSFEVLTPAFVMVIR